MVEPARVPVHPFLLTDCQPTGGEGRQRQFYCLIGSKGQVKGLEWEQVGLNWVGAGSGGGEVSKEPSTEL